MQKSRIVVTVTNDSFRVGNISLSHFNNCSICLNITVTIKKDVMVGGADDDDG